MYLSNRVCCAVDNPHGLLFSLGLVEKSDRERVLAEAQVIACQIANREGPPVITQKILMEAATLGSGSTLQTDGRFTLDVGLMLTLKESSPFQISDCSKATSAGSKKVTEDTKEKRRDFIFEWYSRTFNKVPSSLSMVADMFASHTGINPKHVRNVIYGQSSFRTTRILELVATGKLSVGKINPLVLAPEGSDDKWTVEDTQKWLSRSQAIARLQETLPWLKDCPPAEVLARLFGLSSLHFAQQVALGRRDVGPKPISRLEVSLLKAGFPRGLVGELIIPFALKPEALKKELDSNDPGGANITTASRRYLLEQMHLRLTGKRVTSGNELRRIWAPKIGLSSQSFDINRTEIHLDSAPSKNLCKAYLGLVDSGKMAPDEEFVDLFFGKSDWYQRVQGNNPQALSFYRKLLRTYLLFCANEDPTFRRLSEAIGIEDGARAGFWADIFEGRKHLTSQHIANISNAFESLELNGELSWLLSPLGLCWATTKDLFVARKRVLQAILSTVRSSVPKYLEALDLDSQDTRSLGKGETASGTRILALRKLAAQPCCRFMTESLGGIDGVIFTCRTRTHDVIP